MANNCKIFTPEEYVEELLDAVEYREHLYGQSVLENSSHGSCTQVHFILQSRWQNR